MSDQAKVQGVRGPEQALYDMTRAPILNIKKQEILTGTSGEIFKADPRAVVRIIQNLGTNAVKWAIRDGVASIGAGEHYFVLAPGDTADDGKGGQANASFTTSRLVYLSADGSPVKLSVLELTSPYNRGI